MNYYFCGMDILDLIVHSSSNNELLKCRAKRVALEGITGSALSLNIAAKFKASGGVHVVIMDSKDEAGFLYWDLHNFLDDNELLFFPTGYARSIIFGREDASGIVQRTAVVSALQSHKEGDNLLICSYPEAISEKVAASDQLVENSFVINKGDILNLESVVGQLLEYNFQKVDFVYEPGQFSLRGGILDLFSYSSNEPYRVDMFGDEVETIRTFEINSQRSVAECDSVRVVANLKKSSGFESSSVALSGFLHSVTNVERVTYWLYSPQHIVNKLADIKKKLLKNIAEKGEDIKSLSSYVTGVNEFIEQIEPATIYTIRGELKDDPARAFVDFKTDAQPALNKNFELLVKTLRENIDGGYRNFIVTENRAQIERLENIFVSLGAKEPLFETIHLNLHAGFSDEDAKICIYTDHQIFERQHRYKIANELPKAEMMSISELNALRLGDYVVHLDHGVGRFGGLVRSNEGGKVTEYVKLVYKDGDVLLVNVHSLHKISKYREGESETAVKIHKLGSGAWQKLKLTAKNRVKDIAKDLIKLYAERKASKGFAFSGDNFLQNELEASFIYEDTPDQEKATKDFKRDMECPQPMDRLICGDVGFGKTEIAIRAAFKAAVDGKQVALLVPTTVLALQHYRTFSRRLREFPVTIDVLSRLKSAKQSSELCQRLEQGKIDILIGTHKILGKSVKFKDLGLLIVDEEQKFGVSSKEKLRQLKQNIDTLTLTATPIPRTLQFSLMGARDLSIINTPPPNRLPVDTVVHDFNMEFVKEGIEDELSRGGQVFFIHNRVESIEHIAALMKKVVPEARVAVGHGQMGAEKLEKVMMDFIYGEFDVFVATTIMESGIDIPNANTIFINNAQNFGLSDLHQLRGRVGRTNKKAYCYLLTPPGEPLSESGRRRLRVIEDFSDLGSGFNIAMQDLDIRGAGNLLGGEQSGFISDIGFETYQKIVAEAVMELKQENYMADNNKDDVQNQVGSGQQNGVLYGDKFVADCQIDVDVEAHIPDSYIGQVNEKIRIYKMIDTINGTVEAKDIESMLSDRFGVLPNSVKELINIVLVRKLALVMGFEKVIVKNGFFILHFPSNESSAFYDTKLFSTILEIIPTMGAGFKLKQLPNRLLLSIRGVGGVEEAYNILTAMAEKVKSRT